MNEFKNRRQQNILQNRQMLKTLGFKVIDKECKVTYIKQIEHQFCKIVAYIFNLDLNGETQLSVQ